MSDSTHYLVISGVQENGKKFRPGDWVDRISSALGRLDQLKRFHFSPSVQPCMIQGEKCLVVARDLEQLDPVAYRYVMDFAQANQLDMRLDRRTGSRAGSVVPSPTQRGGNRKELPG
jgi:uncharacterized protein DUF3579